MDKYNSGTSAHDARFTTSGLSHQFKDMNRSTSRDKFPSTSFVIETLKEKHKMLEEKLGIAFQRVQGASTNLSNPESSLMSNSQY